MALAFFSGEDAEAAIPWSKTANAVRKTRQTMPDGLLFLDRLLQLAFVDPVLYPPTDYPGLRKLIDAIKDSTFDTLKADCLVYYLLKDYQDGREAQFAKARALPKRFLHTIDGYWALDHHEYARAVKSLSCPSVDVDFASSILQLLDSQSESQPLASVLINKFVQCAAVRAYNEQGRPIIVKAYVRLQQPEKALAWMRLQAVDDETQNASSGPTNGYSLLEVALHELFATEATRDKALDEMLALPLSSPEEAGLSEWATNKAAATLSSKNLIKFMQWLTSRLIAASRYGDAITFLRAVMRRLKASDEAHRRAQEALQDLRAALPPTIQLLLASDHRAWAAVTESSVVSGKIAQVPWLPLASTGVLPAPRSLIDAEKNINSSSQAESGEPPRLAAARLPLSARGIQSDHSANNGAALRCHDGLLDALRQTGSPRRAGLDRAEREASPLSHTHAFRTKTWAPTVPAFGFGQPPIAAGRALKFGDQLRALYQKAESGPSSSTSRKQGLSVEQTVAQSTPAQRAQHATARGGQPPGAFPVASVAGSTVEGFTDSEDSGREEELQGKSGASQAVEASGRAKETHSEHRVMGDKAERKRTESLTDSSQKVQKKQKKEKKATTPPASFPRRSRRLGSVAPDVPDMMHPLEVSNIENSMMDKPTGNLKRDAAKRRRP